MKDNSRYYEPFVVPAEGPSTIDDALVVGLNHSETTPLSLVGGKAYNLIRLVQAGVSVPEGFCITTAAYSLFAKRNSLTELTQDSLLPLWNTDRNVRRSASERIRVAMLGGAVPDEVAEIVGSHYQQLAGTARQGCSVAVRSSAVAEDLAEASFAGAHATLLNVQGLPALLDAVRTCWASLWMEQVAIYRSRMAVRAGMAMAVVVQKMIEARTSGVLFTMDPLTNDRRRIVIEACWGLGESLVSGKTLPDRYELKRPTFRLHARSYGRQREIVECAGEGTRSVVLEGARRREPCLNAKQLRSLSRIAIEIEERFGGPQDIEWAMGRHGGASSSPESIYILQSRPITVIKGACDPPSCAEPWETPVPGAIWVRQSGGIVEHLPRPASPLFATGQLPLICAHLDAQCPEMGVITPAPTYSLINGYFYNRSDYHLGLKSLLLPLNYWKAARKGARHWRTCVFPEQQRILSNWSEMDLDNATRSQLLQHIQKLFSFNAAAWDNAVRASRTYVFTEPLLMRIFERLIRPVTGGDAITLLCGFDSRIMDGEHFQWKLAQLALASPQVADQLRTMPPEKAWEHISADPSCTAWTCQLNEYCQTYGHVNGNLDYLDPTVADDPTQALRSICVRMDANIEDPFERKYKLTLERQIATRQILDKLAKRPFRRVLFSWITSWAQEGASTRENIFFYALRGWPLARRAILRLGNLLVESGTLSSPREVFFLTWEELQQAALQSASVDLQDQLKTRAARHKVLETLTPPARIPDVVPITIRRKVISWIKPFIVGRSAKSQDGVLWGAPVSPGLATGPARIMFTVDDVHELNPGDILVTPAATPEWTSAFCVVAGLVTDIGGPLSHSSIIAREFGVPTVMGVRIATTTISEGQLITVDGASGSVWLREKSI